MGNLFTEDYIEKCINNPDIQALWVPKEGQCWVCPCKACREREAIGHFLADYAIDAWNKRDLTNVEPCYAQTVKFCGQAFVDNKEYVIWIPRQDELQILLKEKIERFRSMKDLKFDFNMRQCIFKMYCCKILNFLTLNDMWLMFFMKEVFKKQWVPESKSWEIR